jgi:hypothetical protein
MKYIVYTALIASAKSIEIVGRINKDMVCADEVADSPLIDGCVSDINTDTNITVAY